MVSDGSCVCGADVRDIRHTVAVNVDGKIQVGIRIVAKADERQHHLDQQQRCGRKCNESKAAFQCIQRFPPSKHV